MDGTLYLAVRHVMRTQLTVIGVLRELRKRYMDMTLPDHEIDEAYDRYTSLLLDQAEALMDVAEAAQVVLADLDRTSPHSFGGTIGDLRFALMRLQLVPTP